MRTSDRWIALFLTIACAGCSHLLDGDPFLTSTMDSGVDSGRTDPDEDAGTPCDERSCDDQVACTEDACGAEGCIHTPDDAACDDGVSCTEDRCGAEGCVSTPREGACDDGVSCTADTCDSAQGCQHSPEDAACDDGVECTADACDPIDGCTHAPSDASCDDGIECTADACDAEVGCRHAPMDSSCDDGIACTVDRCDVDLGCVHTPDDSRCSDDGEVCTDHRCDVEAGRCVVRNNTASCDDGAFCNGADQCMGGRCVHAGPPCSGGRLCDEAADRCVECMNDSDCPEDETTAWGACGGFDDPFCDATGQQSRGVTSYSCVANACQASARTEVRTCPRPTEGVRCRDRVVGSFGACSYDDATCSEAGVRTRQVTDYACRAERCVASTATELDTAGCARNTQGDRCRDPVFGAYGACSYSHATCSESGQRTRSVTTYACDMGACEETTRTERDTAGCARPTEGNSCGQDRTDWGSCGGFDSTCDESGMRSGTAHRFRCRSSSCRDEATSTRGSCSRNTNGQSCGNGRVCMDGNCLRDLFTCHPPCRSPQRCCDGFCAQICP